MPPPTNPIRKPIGPVIKIPSKGPWLEDGLKIIGPINPIINPILPIIIPPIIMYLNKPFDIAPVCFHTKNPMITAINNETIIGIAGILWAPGINEKGTQKIKK